MEPKPTARKSKVGSLTYRCDGPSSSPSGQPDPDDDGTTTAPGYPANVPRGECCARPTARGPAVGDANGLAGSAELTASGRRPRNAPNAGAWRATRSSLVQEVVAARTGSHSAERRRCS